MTPDVLDVFDVPDDFSRHVTPVHRYPHVGHALIAAAITHLLYILQLQTAGQGRFLPVSHAILKVIFRCVFVTRPDVGGRSSGTLLEGSAHVLPNLHFDPHFLRAKLS